MSNDALPVTLHLCGTVILIEGIRGVGAQIALLQPSPAG
jgi:hypothetical protein